MGYSKAIGRPLLGQNTSMNLMANAATGGRVDLGPTNTITPEPIGQSSIASSEKNRIRLEKGVIPAITAIKYEGLLGIRARKRGMMGG